MAKSHTESQSENAQEGASLEKEARKLVKHFCDNNEKLKMLDIQFPTKLKQKTVTLRDGDAIKWGCVTQVRLDVPIFLNGRLVLVLGCKASFRDRWKQDAFEALLLRTSSEYREVCWIEVFRFEEATDTSVDIKKRREWGANRAGSLFHFVFSTRDQDQVQEAREYITRYLLGRQDLSKRFGKLVAAPDLFARGSTEG